MARYSATRGELNFKIAYSGPAGAGKTTTLRLLGRRAQNHDSGRLAEINSEQDRTLFFEYVQLTLGVIKGVRTNLHIYGVPSSASAASTRRTILDGVDAIVFVADSRLECMAANTRSRQMLEEDLAVLGRELTDVPIAFQWNKRDHPEAATLDELSSLLNLNGDAAFETVATRGQGVVKALRCVAVQVLERIGGELPSGVAVDLPPAKSHVLHVGRRFADEPCQECPDPKPACSHFEVVGPRKPTGLTRVFRRLFS